MHPILKSIRAVVPMPIKKRIDAVLIHFYYVFKSRNLDFVLDKNDHLGRVMAGKGYHGQRGQDYFLDTYVFNGKKTGFFLDIGANHPVELSNTLFFEEQGWTGLAFEPQTRLQSQWAGRRKTECLPILLGDEDKVDVDFISVETDQWQNALSGVSGYIDTGLNVLQSKKLQNRKMPMRRLDEILRERKIKHVDFMSIDVEGFEMNVLRGIDLNEFSVQALVVENDKTFFGSDELRDYIMRQGYEYAACLSGDDVFVKKNRKI